MKKLFLFLLAFLPACLLAQDEYADRKFQFVSYEKVPTWTGVASGWNTKEPVVHLYNSARYKGHADFVSQGLKTGITFKQFKEQVRQYNTRKYLPFFLFDARQHPLHIEGKTYTWALMLEDYSYDDNPEQMALTVLKLTQLVRHYIGVSAKAPEHNNGIIVLSSNPTAKPNESSAPLLSKNGFPHMNITALKSAFGAPRINVLNEGIAYGYLRYMGAGREDSTRLSAHDIVVYEKLPARVPPVSGIITLEPQTPLSHINLLAKNRKTINLYAASMEDIPGLSAHKNKLVKIECTGKKIMLSEPTLEEAKKHWAQRSTRISIPQPLTEIRSIVDLSSTDKSLLGIPCIGAKAANYALIQKAFPAYVRPGFAVSFHWYFQTLHACGADSVIGELVKKKNTLGDKEKILLLQNIQNRIMKTRLDTQLLHQVKKLADTRFAGSRIRLRSSTNCEDLPEFNGAGLYVSKGYTTKDSLHKLEKKILQVYASLWSVTAFEEREFYFIDHTKAGMALLINEAYTDEYANGVVLTIPNKKGCAVFINTQAGANLVTNPVNGQVPEAILFPSATDTAYVVESRSNVKDIFLSGQPGASLQEMKKLAMDVQRLFDGKQVSTGLVKYGVDIEFRIMREKDQFKLYIKQARLLRQVLPE